MPDPDDFEPDGEDQERKAGVPKAESKIWVRLKSHRGNIKTNRETGSKQRFYQWDYTHNEIEVYNHRFQLLGAMDSVTGKMIKGPASGRNISNLMR